MTATDKRPLMTAKDVADYLGLTLGTVLKIHPAGWTTGAGRGM
jgi:hypothetical protein